VVAVPQFSVQLPNIPTDYAQRLVKQDFGAMAKKREAVLAEWSKRYESKAAPR
jgi:iron(III) transport system substrate-binding protein